MHCRLLFGLVTVLAASGLCWAENDPSSWAEDALEVEDSEHSQTEKTEPSGKTRSLFRNVLRLNTSWVNAPSIAPLRVNAAISNTGRVNTPSTNTASVSTPNRFTTTVSAPSVSGTATVNAPNTFTTTVSAPSVSGTATVSAPSVTGTATISAPSLSDTASSGMASSGKLSTQVPSTSASTEMNQLPHLITAILEKARPYWNIPAVDFGGRMKRDVNIYVYENPESPNKLQVTDYSKRYGRLLSTSLSADI